MTNSTLTTCLLMGALALTGCHKNPEPEQPAPKAAAPAAPQPQAPTAQVPNAKDTAMAGMAAGKADSAMAAGMDAPSALTDQLSSKLGLTPAQTTAGVGTILAYAKNKLPADQFDKLSSSIPGSADMLQSAKDAGAVSDATPISDPAGLSSALSKIGITPEIQQQLVPAVGEYVTKLAGPEVGGAFKSLF